MENSEKQFIALYGGSYNLPTLTHRAIGIEVRDQVKPDEVWYQVSAQNPHKSREGMAPFDDRVAMARLNIQDQPGLVVSEAEKEICARIGTNESAAVLRDMIAHNSDKRFAWVMGADCFAKLHTWGDYEYILSHASIIVVPRKGWTEQALNSVAARHSASRRTKDAAALRHENAWYLLDFPEDDVSATNGRSALHGGSRPDYVHRNVWNHAKSHALFL